MGDALARVRAVVDDEAEAVGELELFREEMGDEEKMAYYDLIRGGHLADPRDEFLRHDDQVNGRLRLDVVEDDAEFVLVLDLRRDFAVDDFLEKSLHVKVAGSE